MRNLIEETLDHALNIAFGGFTTFLFTSIAFFDIIGVYENNLVILYSELIFGILILCYGVYRLIRMIRYYKRFGVLY